MQGGSRSKRKPLHFPSLLPRDTGSLLTLRPWLATLTLLIALSNSAFAQWREPLETTPIRRSDAPSSAPQSLRVADNSASTTPNAAPPTTPTPRPNLGPTLQLPEQAAQLPVAISGLKATNWTEGSYDAYQITGDVVIKQGDFEGRASEAIVWVDAGDPYLQQPSRVLVYLEGNVDIRFAATSNTSDEQPRNRYRASEWFGRFNTVHSVQVNVQTAVDPNRGQSPVAERARAAMRSKIDQQVVPAQFPQLDPTAPLPAPTQANGTPADPAADSNMMQANVQFTGRNGGRPNIQSYSDPNRNEQTWLFDNGIRITLRSPQFDSATGALAGIDEVVLMADRGVAWTSTLQSLMETPAGDLGGQRWEFYLEGNIVFVAGERVVYSDYLYYDANFKRGTILNAEILSPVDGYDGLMRLKTDVLQQIDEQTFRAYDAAVTSSRLGYPAYWVQSGNIEIKHEQIPRLDPFSGGRAYDPETGQPLTRHEYQTVSRNNFVYVGGLPVFYWPTLSNDLANPTYYLEQISLKTDSVFGTQILTDWNMYQLLGIRDKPEGTDWTLVFDTMSERGFGLGTEFTWDRNNMFGIPGPYQGRLDAWGINDNGLDNLGQDRRAVPLEEDLRYRILGQHRHRFESGWQVTGEVGWISDRNFLEQYYEREWDREKDQATGAQILRNDANRQFTVNVDTRINDFFTQTEWLPRVDYSIVGQPILGDVLVWTGRTHAGYARLQTAEAPVNAVDLAKFDPLAWEQDVETPRIGTRQMLELPIPVGPVQVSLYGLGDATYYGEDLTGDDLTRLYGQTGIRTSLPFWKVDPTVNSELFNVNGLAHKISFDSDFFYSDTNANFDELPMLDALDDDAQEAFRRRFFFDTFGGVPGGDVPLQFDERTYAIRSNLMGNVTSPSMDLTEDLMGMRMSVNQRWQTRRGAPGEQRIIDWITFDVGGTYFPRGDRDNFGEDFGLFDAKFRWHVGDRFTLLSDASADLFGDGLRTVSLGAQMGRPEQGNLYIGFRSIEGPLTANILTGSFSYRMSEKWIATAGGSVDFGPTGNIGQTLSFTRIGESFLLRFGIRADASRGNVGAIFGIEPRFLSRSRMGQLGGVSLPPPGSRGLE